MGLTVIEKSDPRRRRSASKIALVLAGGAFTGGAFKLGAVRALDDFLVDRRATEFDMYVGLSAGALLAASFAAGVTPRELQASLDGEAGAFAPFGALDAYWPNTAELVEKPIAYLRDLARWTPAALGDVVREAPGLLARLPASLRAFARSPSWTTACDVLAPAWDAAHGSRAAPFALDYLPTGLFDNAAVERYLRTNFERNGIPNDFRALHRARGAELYIVATNLDTAERTVFGHDEEAAASISEAVQASTALPGFYRPARVRGVDYVDGGVRRTANLDVAIEHGADLIVCYNPFRPLTNHVLRPPDPDATDGTAGARIAGGGLLTVLNQVLRTLLHSRLQLGLLQYLEDPNFQGDIVLVEPAEADHAFFRMSPMNLWLGGCAARHGYLAASRSLDAGYDVLAGLFARHGLRVSRTGLGHSIESQPASSGAAAARPLRDALARDLHAA
jgi:predicted acylesterase/phospholipase RssA